MFSDYFQAAEYDQISGRRLYLRPMQMRDADEWIALRTESQGQLRPWEPTWAEDALSKEAYKRRLRYFAKTAREDTCYAYLVFHAATHCLMGGLTMNNVRRGVTDSASLGYWLGTPYLRQNYMTEAVVATVKHGFERMHLNRMEAACLPRNEASARVLIKAGFQEEGYARAYRRINGRWEDHRLFGIVRGDPLPAMCTFD